MKTNQEWPWDLTSSKMLSKHLQILISCIWWFCSCPWVESVSFCESVAARHVFGLRARFFLYTFLSNLGCNWIITHKSCIWWLIRWFSNHLHPFTTFLPVFSHQHLDAKKLEWLGVASAAKLSVLLSLSDSAAIPGAVPIGSMRGLFTYIWIFLW